MPRRELLSPAQRESLLSIPIKRASLIEHYILDEQDLTFLRQRRGAHNRIGMAVQLAILRHPGRALQPEESPPAELLNFLAAQLKADASDWMQYAVC